MPAAINLRTEVEGGREAPGRVKVESMDLGGERDEVDADSEFTGGRWSDYVIAALRAMRRRGGMRVGGAELIVRSGIPMGGAGLGSSSALLVAIIKWFGASLGAGLTRGGSWPSWRLRRRTRSWAFPVGGWINTRRPLGGD